jgi:CRP-like cAMP-binding protein
MLRYVHVFMMQLANTVLANSARIEQRLARWLLMYQDRIRGVSLAVTHQALSSMLGVRRAGITEAIHVLEGRKMIRSQRGLINILDRPRLEMMTAGSYGGPEAEYRRLI